MVLKLLSQEKIAKSLKKTRKKRKEKLLGYVIVEEISALKNGGQQKKDTWVLWINKQKQRIVEDMEMGQTSPYLEEKLFPKKKMEEL